MNTEQLAARVESLERGMRRWRRLASVLVVGLVVTVAATRQEEIPDVVKARAFAVVNKAGKPVVVMGASEDGNGHVHVNNKAGELAAAMGAFENGDGHVSVKNKDGEIVVALAADKDGDGVVSVGNKAGKRVWQSPNK